MRRQIIEALAEKQRLAFGRNAGWWRLAGQEVDG